MLHVGNTNPLSIVAFESAYKGGDAWLNALMKYLESTRDYVADFLQEHIPQVKCSKPEATYLMWLDCKGLGMTDAQLRDFFVKECQLGLNPGVVFGEVGSGFMRMNIGTTKANIEQALDVLNANIKLRRL
jgi:cystathionine beta-lyase